MFLDSSIYNDINTWFTLKTAHIHTFSATKQYIYNTFYTQCTHQISPYVFVSVKFNPAKARHNSDHSCPQSYAYPSSLSLSLSLLAMAHSHPMKTRRCHMANTGFVKPIKLEHAFHRLGECILKADEGEEYHNLCAYVALQGFHRLHHGQRCYGKSILDMLQDYQDKMEHALIMALQDSIKALQREQERVAENPPAPRRHTPLATLMDTVQPDTPQATPAQEDLSESEDDLLPVEPENITEMLKTEAAYEKALCASRNPFIAHEAREAEESDDDSIDDDTDDATYPPTPSYSPNSPSYVYTSPVYKPLDVTDDDMDEGMCPPTPSPDVICDESDDDDIQCTYSGQVKKIIHIDQDELDSIMESL